MKCLIKTSTGSVQRWGYCTFIPGTGETQVDLTDQTPPSDTPPKFWKVVSGVFVEMTTTEKNAVRAEDAANFYHSLGSPTSSPFEIDWSIKPFQVIYAVANLTINFKGPVDSQNDKISFVANNMVLKVINNTSSDRTWTWSSSIIWQNYERLLEVKQNSTYYIKITSVESIYLASLYRPASS